MAREVKVKGETKKCNSVVNPDFIHARQGSICLSKMQHLEFCKCKNCKEYFCDMCYCKTS